MNGKVKLNKFWKKSPIPVIDSVLNIIKLNIININVEIWAKILCLSRNFCQTNFSKSRRMAK